MVSVDQAIQDFRIWEIVKIFYLIFLFLYIIFALIIVRQIHLMTHTLNGSLNLPLKTLGYIHLILAGFIFFLAVVLL